MAQNENMQLHRKDVSDIQQQFINHLKNADRNPLSLCKKEHLSNTIRENSYKKPNAQLSIHKLCRVLHIDKEKKIAYVEPRVTMEKLVRETLKWGLLPPVVPEFKGITVGGAIMGAALESSSHVFGQFNDSCLAYEILLGDGSIIRATKTEHADLFYGISGSYGSLGIILGIELCLISAQKNVKLTYRRFPSVALALDEIESLHQQTNPPEYLEGLVFEKGKSIVISGVMTPEVKKTVSLGHSWSPWFYQHAKEKSKDFPMDYEEIMSIEDYIFRYDRGAFWMGAYALHGKILLRYILDILNISPKGFQKWQSLPNTSCDNHLKYPGCLFRWLFGWMMSSRRLYTLLHFQTEKWFADRFIIQDFYIPKEKTALFVEEVLNKYHIIPIWLCPLKSTNSPQLLAPHSNIKTELLFDVGVYGFPLGVVQAFDATKDLEKRTQILEGRKMLYGYSYYSKKEFWEIYSLDGYQKLRQKYNADQAWLNITEKVLFPDQNSL